MDTSSQPEFPKFFADMVFDRVKKKPGGIPIVEPIYYCQYEDNPVEQNEQIPGMSYETIIGALELKPFSEHEAAVRERNRSTLDAIPKDEHGLHLPRGTGRTTRMLVEAIMHMSKGRKVGILVPNPIVGRELMHKLDRYLDDIRVATGRKIHNLARWLPEPSWRDQNEFLLTEHTYEVAG